MDATTSQAVVTNLLDQVDDLKKQVSALKADGGVVGPIPPPPAGGVVPSVEWKGGEAKAQDFIKGWPSVDMISTDHIRKSLSRSFNKGIAQTDFFLNYGDTEHGAYMYGTPYFRQALAEYLSGQYNRPVDWNTLMTTSGGSMGVDLVLRQHCKAGDYAVVEEPTYFLSHTMMRDRDMTNLLGVPMEADGMDVNALEEHCKANPGKIKAVYSVVIHHNPSGITMSNEKRAKLVALAKKYDFLIIADEAYQLVTFEPMPDIVPLFYHDDPADPRVFSVGTFSKVIGPGIKVGWVHAHPPLLEKLKGVGWIDSGNNPVIYQSGMLIDFLKSGELARHNAFVNRELSKKCKLLCAKLRDVGITDFYEPNGGYFVWVKARGKKTGKSGEACSINRDRFGDMMRLCFAWATYDTIIEGIEYLRED